VGSAARGGMCGAIQIATAMGSTWGGIASPLRVRTARGHLAWRGSTRLAPRPALTTARWSHRDCGHCRVLCRGRVGGEVFSFVEASELRVRLVTLRLWLPRCRWQHGTVRIRRRLLTPSLASRCLTSHRHAWWARPLRWTWTLSCHSHSGVFCRLGEASRGGK
jgi:hypothetical protein